MRSSKAYWRILGVLAALLLTGLILLLAALFNQSPAPAPAASPQNSVENNENSVERHKTAAPPANQIEVELYFPAPGSSPGGFGILQEERRRIRRSSSSSDLARALLEELFTGPREGGLPVIPPAARLHQVYILKDGRAVLNYSHGLVENCPEGVEGEAALIYSIVNTLTRNISEIRGVRILIDGNERETLSGHLDLSGFLQQDMSLVRGSAPAVDAAPVQPPAP